MLVALGARIEARVIFLDQQTMTSNDKSAPMPSGDLALQTLAMPKDTNANGDIFGGWLVSQMDLAAGIATKKVAQGRAATVAIQNITFIKPVSVGSTVSCYTTLVKTGRSSMHIDVEVWMANWRVAAGLFVYVAIDDDGNPRPLPI